MSEDQDTIVSEFQESEGWRFRRLADGRVQMVVGNCRPREAVGGGSEAVHTISPEAWASVVSSVSHQGEDGGRFYKALEFHTGESPHPTTMEVVQDTEDDDF